MDNPLMDVEGARERLEAWKAKAEQRAAETQAASEGLQALRITAGDDNGIAEVTVDSSGALVDIRLSSRIQRQAPEYTQTAVLGAYRNARKKLAEAAAEVVSDTVGSESATGKALMAGFKTDDEGR
ncbi:YbaB/EbfC family nucleoid-associated protein [Glycomyces tenuis]|uniref:YbaB/EbfC family nucleoid-associated protein n=1 Tax=Glycomyces tenuis TaxID=58116 RepID=UPI000408473E|nr:YbaB/EbfC family nucleoid-associated protein [Glycomyces tenuis]